MFLFDLSFRYEDESSFRPYVVYCDMSKLHYYIDRVSRLACVVEIKIDISTPDPTFNYQFHEYTI